MWIVEVNIVGHRFTHELRRPRRRVLGFRPRALTLFPSHLRDPGAA
jgi:hypothetical protein